LSKTHVKVSKIEELIIFSWRLDLPNPPAFGRETFDFKVKSLGPGGNDDVYTLNTQSGSQVNAI
jgi:hypothetical protein